MPKELKKKKPKVIKQKQKQKQQISIVINSNNRSKRTTVPRPPPPPPPQAPRNNPPVVNIMGETRPQVSPSGNFSGIGQQNRIFANDSALEQRLSRLLKFENDQSANATPALSNTKVLSPQPPQPPPRATSPYKVKFQAPPSNPVMNLDFFNTRRKAYEDAQEQKAQDDEEKQQEPDDIDETKSTPSLMDRAISFFKPKPNPLVQVSPIENRLDDVYIKEEGEEEKKEPATAYPASPPQHQELNKDNLGELDKPWNKMKRIEKREWALANRGDGAEYVKHTEDEIDSMLVGPLNELYAGVILARRQTLDNSKRI